MTNPRRFASALVLFGVCAGGAFAQGGAETRATDEGPATRATTFPEAWTKSLEWRSIGPAGMGGRVTGIAIFEAEPSTWWVATASGGLLKTTNNGVTFEHQFDREATVSIGAVAVAASDKNVVWVGTGEANPRNSVTWGDGVYKSTDGGKSWTNMGLRDSFQIGSIAIHPTNPDVVYVGALGRLYGSNAERGLFKTTDGGASWSKILYFDDETGVMDVELKPGDPETLIVCAWARRRDGFDSFTGTPSAPEGHDVYDPAFKWGAYAGLYKSIDGGASFKKLERGLPSGKFGRCDVDWYRKDPNVLYAIVDCENIGKGPPPSRAWLGVYAEDHDLGAKLSSVTEDGPASRAGLRVDDLVVSVAGEKVQNASTVLEAIRSRKPGDSLTLRVRRGEEETDVVAALEDRPLSVAAAQGSGPPQAYLGVSTEEDAASSKLKVVDVPEGSPADRAGLKSGDALLELDGEPLTSVEQLNELIRMRRPAERVVFGVLSKEKEAQTNVAVTLGERPAGGGGGGAGGGRGGPGMRAAAALGAYLGASVRPREARDGRDDGGLEVASVAPERAAEAAGLSVGDVVVAYDDVEATDLDAFVEFVGKKKEGDVLSLRVRRGDETKDVAFKLEPDPKTSLRPFGYLYAGQMPNMQERQGADAHEYGGVYRSEDAGETWTRVNSLNPRPMYFSKVRVDPSDDRNVFVLGVSLHRSSDGGRLFTADGGSRVHADFHALWIDPKDGAHLIAGCDGGFYVSWDRTKRWEHLNHQALAQFYHACVDTRSPYRVYGGLQDNGSWGGPSRSRGGSGVLNEDWINVGGGDGFICFVDPFEPDVVYSESQNGAMSRRDLRTGRSTPIRPRPKPGVRYRFNWKTPFVLSSHNPGIFYCAGNYVFRSVKRGDDLRPISPEINATGRGTATAIAESPVDPEVLWCGTDDGALWTTKDGGANWTNVAAAIGLPGAFCVASIEASRFAAGRCYVAFDAHRSDDDKPYVFVTENYGASWRSIVGNLPVGSTRCLREDVKNRSLLYCGTEFAAWASLDRGRTWTKINNNLPTVAVHDFAVHPTAGEIVAATHGRGIWILDVTTLRGATSDALAAGAHLFEPNAVVRYASEPSRGTGTGHQRFVATNPPSGARFAFALAADVEKAALRVLDVSGRVLHEQNVPKSKGLHVASWDLTDRPARRGGGAAGGRGARPRPAPPGVYRVVLEIDGKTYDATLQVLADPNLPPELAAEAADAPVEDASESGDGEEEDR